MDLPQDINPLNLEMYCRRAIMTTSEILTESAGMKYTAKQIRRLEQTNNQLIIWHDSIDSLLQEINSRVYENFGKEIFDGTEQISGIIGVKTMLQPLQKDISNLSKMESYRLHSLRGDALDLINKIWVTRRGIARERNCLDQSRTYLSEAEDYFTMEHLTLEELWYNRTDEMRQGLDPHRYVKQNKVTWSDLARNLIPLIKDAYKQMKTDCHNHRSYLNTMRRDKDLKKQENQLDTLKEEINGSYQYFSKTKMTQDPVMYAEAVLKQAGVAVKESQEISSRGNLIKLAGLIIDKEKSLYDLVIDYYEKKQNFLFTKSNFEFTQTCKDPYFRDYQESLKKKKRSKEFCQ